MDNISLSELGRLENALTHLRTHSYREFETSLLATPENPTSPPWPLIAHYTEVRQARMKDLSLPELISAVTVFLLVATATVSTSIAASTQDSSIPNSWHLYLIPVMSIVIALMVARNLLPRILDSKKGALSVGLHELRYKTFFGMRNIRWDAIDNAFQDSMPWWGMLFSQERKCIKVEFSDGTGLWFKVPEIIIQVLTDIMRELINQHRGEPPNTSQE